MAYLNNPDAVLDEIVDLDQPEDKLFACIVGVIRTIVGEQWSTVSSESVDITKLTGGITNILFMAVDKVTGAKVIVRIYGLGTSEFIDRNSENVVFATLSKLNFGPTFYGLFKNGRLEGYLPALALQLEEMGDSSIVPAIASAVAKLHSFDVDAIKKVRWLWTKIETFMTLAENAVCKKEGEDADKAATVSTAATAAAVCDIIVKMRGEAVWLERYLQERELEYTNSSNSGNNSNCSNSNEQQHQQQQRQRGRRYGMSECLCHNDLLSGNILLRNQQLVEAEEALSTAVGLGQHSQDLEKKKEESLPPVAVAVAVAVHIIDYEYAAYNYRAFDIANHFSEYCGFEYDLDRSFPSEEKMRFFLRSYLDQQQKTQQADLLSGHDEAFIDGYMDAVRWTLLASHLFWGSWALVQAACSSIDFDYSGYARRRFSAYFLHKNMFV